MPKRPVGLAVGLLLAAGTLAGQAGAARRIAITDRDELAAAGLPRDSKNVYRWVGRVAESESATSPAPSVPQTWGPATGFTTLSSMQLKPEHASVVIQQPDQAFCVLGAGGAGAAQEALAELSLPAGASLSHLSVWGYDVDPDYGMKATLYEFCQAQGFNPPTTTLIGSLSTIGSAGPTYDATPLFAYPVNNRDCGYSVRIIFIPGDATCRHHDIQFRKLSVLWERQVSPPPGTATFSDVPADHPFYQYVEALAKSGITGGCGGGKFCPDSPLTRGQMAVFLAKGLGMGWQ